MCFSGQKGRYFMLGDASQDPPNSENVHVRVHSIEWKFWQDSQLTEE